jgi:uncharacterized membrane protein YccC
MKRAMFIMSVVSLLTLVILPVLFFYEFLSKNSLYHGLLISTIVWFLIGALKPGIRYYQNKT